MHRLLSLLGLVVALAATRPAHAYNVYSFKLTGSSHTVYLDPDVQTTMPDQYAVLQTAATKLDANASDMRFVLMNDNDGAQVINNGESEAGFTRDADKLCSSIACTTLTFKGTTLLESDTFFDLDYPWTVTSSKIDNVGYGYDGGARPLLNTALHEFSHALGMDHENRYFQVMGRAWTTVNANGALTQSVISEDTTEGLIAQYGLRSASIEDLSLYHWERTGASGEYSIHSRTKLAYTSGVELLKQTPTSTNPEPTYLGAPGLAFQLWATAENRGRTSHTVKLRWYLSQDDLITTGDTLLGSQDITVNPNLPFTFARTLTLPNNLVGGATYWVGGVLDADDDVAEQNESNNATYIAAIVIL